jgi:hypothetical protein
MSDLNQIHTALERLFNEEGQRIVFWNDPDRGAAPRGARPARLLRRRRPRGGHAGVAATGIGGGERGF